MDHLKKYVFIAEIIIYSSIDIVDLYKIPTKIVDGLIMEFSADHGVKGVIYFEAVEEVRQSLSFRVLIETENKRMYDQEEYYIQAVRTYLQSFLFSDYEMKITVIKLRIPSMLTQQELNRKIYTDLDGDRYKLTRGNLFIRIDPSNEI